MNVGDTYFEKYFLIITGEYPIEMYEFQMWNF